MVNLKADHAQYIFPFNGSYTVPSSQDDTQCKSLFDHFWETVLERNLHFDVDQLVDAKESVVDIKFVSMCGCVLLFRPTDDLNVSITVVGLDGWKYHVLSTVNGRHPLPVPTIPESCSLFVETIDKLKISQTIANFDKNLQDAYRDNARSSYGPAGNQKTPSFVRSILIQTLNQFKSSCDDEKKKSDCIQGGTTDVGVHTGCIQRNTSFALVLAAVYRMINDSGELVPDNHLYDKSVAVYYESFLQAEVEQITMYDARKIDRVMVIIRSIRQHVESVSDQSFCNVILNSIQKAHEKICNLPYLDKEKTGYKLKLPTIEELQMLKPPSWTDPPSPPSPLNVTDRLQKARSEALKNINYSDLQCYDCAEQLNLQSNWVVFHNLCKYFWKLADTLNVENEHLPDISIIKVRIQSLTKVVSNLVGATKGVPHIMKVTLTSSKLLATWIGYCWAHRFCEKKFSCFQQEKYGVSLDHIDLKHIVLEDQAAIKAVEYVRNFLSCRNASLRPFRFDDTSTFELAISFCKSNAGEELRQIYVKELAAANAMIDERWIKIQESQTKLREFDARLVFAKSRLNQAEEILRQEETNCTYSRFTGQREYSYSYEIAKTDRDHCKTKCESLQSKIKELEKKPADCFIGLPRDKNLALKWLYMLYMPKEFCDLAELAQQGELQLWEKKPPTTKYVIDLVSWFEEHNLTCRNFARQNCQVLFLVSNSERPCKLNTPNIRNYQKESGVFFPDSLQNSLCWKESNPFMTKVDEAQVAKLYTEILPHPFSFMQNLIVMRPSATRENEGVAMKNWQTKLSRHQEEEVQCRSEFQRLGSWLTREQYLVFSGLRAHQNTQARFLLEAIQDKLLPFDHCCVHILVKQLMYQVGEKVWKTDLMGPDWKGLSLFSDELKRQADIVRNATQKYDVLALFGNLSTFLGYQSTECQFTAKEFSDIAFNWYQERHVLDSNDQAPQDCFKQAKYLAYSIIVRALGIQNSSDYLKMAETIVLFQSKKLLASQISLGSKDIYISEWNDIVALDIAVTHVMSFHVLSIMAVINNNISHLTKCLELIVVICGQRPNTSQIASIPWSPMRLNGEEITTGCYEAVYNNVLYSINLLNGTVLVDGKPPSVLPFSIVNDPLYIRTFGSQNFETIPGQESIRTARNVDEKYIYEFASFANGNLQIYEVSDSDGRKQLLQRETLTLPPILREKHSHWFSLERQTVFVRGIRYNNRSVAYVMTRDCTYVIPAEFQKKEEHVIMDNLGQFQCVWMGKTSIVKHLSHFEMEKFIHIVSNPAKDSFCYSLPRYDLSFVHSLEKHLVESMEFVQYSLHESPFLKDTLPGLDASIVLVNEDGHRKVLIRSGKVSAHRKLLVQSGKVRTQSQVQIEVVDDLNATLTYHIYDEHPRLKNLVATTTLGRFHLASLYASNSCYLYDKRIGKPGADVAADLVRECWRNEPFSSEEKNKLEEIASHSSFSCHLQLVCIWVWKSSISACLLHKSNDTESEDIVAIPPTSSLEVDELSKDEYKSNYRYCCRLTYEEELYLFGTRQPNQHLSNYNADMLYQNKKNKTAFKSVKKVENELMQTHITMKNNKNSTEFPLNDPLNISNQEKKIIKDLKNSYNEYIKLSVPEVRDLQIVEDTIRKLLSETEPRLVNTQKALLTNLEPQISSSSTFWLEKFSGQSWKPTPRDLLRIIVDVRMIQRFNRYMTEQECYDFRQNAIYWACLCVLVDKLKRILHSIKKSDYLEVTKELLCVRGWDPYTHPTWLVFEVEQQIQIRPHQYSTFKQLKDSPRSAIQLNMGMGKTRVIIPMFISYYMAMGNTNVVTRINLLPQIMNEALNYLQSTLTASVLNVKIFTLPFSRDVSLNSGAGNQILDQIAKCCSMKGCFIVTPQHRNSLLLQQHEEDYNDIKRMKYTFCDIFDEIDAILHHDFQLVYALNKPYPLEHGPTRWTMFEMIIKVVSTCTELREEFFDPKDVHCEKSIHGSFAKVRFLAPFARRKKEFSQKLARKVLENASTVSTSDFMWMDHINNNLDLKELVVSIISDADFENFVENIGRNHILQTYQNDLLAARGAIAYGLLFHVLMMRYRVQYGLSLDAHKRLAVPYSATDTPKFRAEYSHPDVAIFLTILSYFYEGLTKEQFRQALTHLQTMMGPIVQETMYNSWYQKWYESVRDDVVSVREGRQFDQISKVDLTNHVLFEIIYKNFKYSMDVICYWLNNFVFEFDTYQFPCRRATSAWNLVESDNVIGFSGTDDNKDLLPLKTRQIMPQEKEAQATNGLMIDRILECSRNYSWIVEIADGTSSVPLWKNALMKCYEVHANALIDVGGLMAGCTNQEAAQFLATNFVSSTEDSPAKGIVYFNIPSNQWDVLDLKNQQVCPLKHSYLLEKDCFVFFDESRCRGADMKLNKDALAVVTLDPNISKDKFLQGCARMRKLDDGQKLLFIGTNEVISLIASNTTTTRSANNNNNTITTTTTSTSTTVSIKQLLEKVVHNTAKMIHKGIMTYYERGMQYYQFPEPIKDDFSLGFMYRNSIPHYEDISEMLFSLSTTTELSTEQQELVDHCTKLGEGMDVASNEIFTECERELELQEEEEEEKEVEYQADIPFTQQDWQYHDVFDNYEQFFDNELFLPLKSYLASKAHQSSGLASIATISWSTKLYCTKNFWYTISSSSNSNANDMSYSLRPVNPLLIIPDGRVVLISSYELDKLLPIWWARCTNTTSIPRMTNHRRVVIQHLYSLDKKQWFGFDDITTTANDDTRNDDTRVSISIDVMASLKLFRGYVHCNNQEESNVLQNNLLQHLQDPISICKELLHLRNRTSFYDLSDLSKAATNCILSRVS